MDIIIVSCPDSVDGEIDLINRMFEKGLVSFHLRKPDYDTCQLTEYINKIETVFHSQIIIHSCFELLDQFTLGGIHIPGRVIEKKDIIQSSKDRNISISTSFHSLGEVTGEHSGFDYVFLSPVFDSISKQGYKRKFDYNELSEVLTQARIKVVALGGCSAENLNQVKQLGFSGAAFLGAIWNTTDPFSRFIKLKETAKGTD